MMPLGFEQFSIKVQGIVLLDVLLHTLHSHSNISQNEAVFQKLMWRNYTSNMEGREA